MNLQHLIRRRMADLDRLYADPEIEPQKVYQKECQILSEVADAMAAHGHVHLFAVGQKTRVDGNRVKVYLSKCLAALTPEPTALTPPKVAKLLGVNPDKVLAWIRKGDLHATNVTAKPGGRPRYRIEREDLEAFKNRRTPRAKVKPQRVISSKKTYF